MRIAATMLLVVLTPLPLLAGSPTGWMLELRLGEQRIEGTPLAWDERTVYVLGRDGRLWDFAPGEAADYRKTAARFRSYSPSEFRATLLRELGGGYEVSGTGHYLVAHPRGQRDRWAERFEGLYRSFQRYFRVRGFHLEEPPFPLVGVVCRNRREFAQYAADHQGIAGGGVVGYYSIQSNRIILYDAGGGRGGDGSWAQNAATILHEATHQAAFNTGVHSRYAPPPLWVAEGLATSFEAPGVHNSRYHPERTDRINQDRFRYFRDHVRPRHRPELLEALVASDGLFRSAPGTAYAEAWALTFFLAETRPADYARYLARTAARPPLQSYTAAQRKADFTAVFGKNWAMLEARFLRFLDSLP